ncbi:MAG: transmembrane anchor protein [Desulfobulbaceae bacterium]|uniref:Transmembrane anchor protein n=1 Tax=Candidatus Desulfobia pelagia TaxID=2841692 RepID=A0A8J6NFE7_9BACT|nr:transmembrane anchor protein [Candidatus Desulfobia pelagia]
MNNNHRPSDSELPSVAKLIKSTVIAITLAAIILVTVVLPSEYGIDPTGIGNQLGLSKMGEIKVSLAQEAEANTATVESKKTANDNSAELVSASVEKTAITQQSSSVRNDKITISLFPNQGKEVKLKMNKGEQVKYVWWTDQGRANFDVHADSIKHQIDYHGYEKGSTDRKEGDLEAAFDGKHGWFWRNRTSKTMTITLEVEGAYSEINEV